MAEGGVDSDADEHGDGNGDGDADEEDSDLDGGATCSEGWFDPSSGLCWQDPPAESNRNWDAAVAYCDGLSLGGHGPGSWHLPDIDELRSLIRNCAGTETGGACGVTGECLAGRCCSTGCEGCPELGGPGPGGCYWPEGLGGGCNVFWSSSSYADGDGYAWYVYFNYGSVYYMDKAPTYGVRCVRRLP